MIRFVAETGSTSADLAAELAAGAPLVEGDWLVAHRQSDGRGRQGRAWSDGAGNFMGSTVVRLGTGDPPPGSLSLMAGVALHDALAAVLPLPQRAMLKWPNDAMVGAAKLAGILLERVGDRVVVGIGVNLAAAPQVPGREVTAISAFTPPPSPETFAALLAGHFATELGRWRSYGLGPTIARWLSAAHPVGTPLSVGEPGEPALSGTFAGLAEDGALQLRLADGTTRVIHAGEVRLE